MPHKLHKDREDLLDEIRGQTIIIKDIQPYFAHWPASTSPHLRLLRQDTDAWVKSIVGIGKAFKTLKAADFALFGATWWPCAPFERLKIVSRFAAWLFLWDDDIDSEAGVLWSNYTAAQTHRKETLSYVKYTLGLQESHIRTSDKIILSFKSIGEALSCHYTYSQKTTFVREMEYFMTMSERQHHLSLSGYLPSVSQFWNYRLGISAVSLCLAVNEFSWPSMNLPQIILSDPDMQAIWIHTNTIICAVNDLYSLKKEIHQGAVDSLVPLIYASETGNANIQATTDEVIDFVQQEVRSFDQAAETLLDRYRNEVDNLEDNSKGYEGSSVFLELQQFIQGCRQYCTGNLNWSLSTRRYDVGKRDEEGNVVVEL